MKDAGQHTGPAPLNRQQASALVIEALETLLRAAPDNLQAAIDTVLARVASATGCDRAHVLINTDGHWSVANEWCAAGIAPRFTVDASLPAEVATDWADGENTEETFQICAARSLPDGPERRALLALGVQSQIAVHFPPDAAVRGFVSLECVTDAPICSEIVPWLLRSLGNGMSATLARRHAETRLKSARDQQSETLERLRATLAAMPELLLEMDENGVCIDLHCTRPELLARPPEELIGQSLEQTLPPDVARLQRRGMDDARLNGKAEVGPYALGEGDAERWYVLTIVRRVGSGTQDGFVFRAHDVTDEHARTAENNMLVEMARRMNNMAMVLEPDFRIRWVNSAFEARSGYNLAELRGRLPNEFEHPEADPVEVARLVDALRTRTPARAEVRKHARNGEAYDVAVEIQPMLNTDNGFEGFIVIETDITQRLRHEADLKRLAAEAETSREKLQAAIEAIPDAFAIFDADDRLTMFNSQYRNALPGTASQIRVGASFEEILDYGIKIGDFPQSNGQVAEWKARRLALHAKAEGDMELRLSTGRWTRAYERATPDGGRVGLRVDITALKNAEQRLSEIIDGARIGTWEFSAATKASDLNKHWATMLGVDAKSLKSIGALALPELAHPDDYAGLQEEMRLVLSGAKQSLEQEIRLRHNAGHWVHVLLRGQLNDGDKPREQRRISGVGLDLTERRNAEERLQTILEASTIGTWQLNSQSGECIIDEQYAAMLGYTLTDLLPWTKAKFERLMHPMDIPRLHAGLAALYQSNKTTIRHEFRMRHREGHWIWILSQARVALWDSAGNALEESGIHIDITESKSREAALAEAKHALEQALSAQKASDERFADIVAVSDEWFWEVDEQERIVFMSSGFERITGFSVPRIHGRTLTELGYTAEVDGISGDWRAMAAQIAKREKLADLLFRLSPHGKRPAVWLRISGAPIFREDGTYLGYRGAGSDVTEFITATERAEAANLAKSRFIATMSHELRTPLTGVLGMADILSETPVTKDQREMIDTIRDSGEGLLAIVNDILDLAKIEAGKMTVDRLVFAPADLFRRVHALFAPRAHSVGLALTLEVCAQCRESRLGDAHRIQQILNNLVGNAIKFTAAGSIKMAGSIAPSDQGDILTISIADTGIGMTPEQSAKVFEEFEQAEGSTARRFGGTGLGLSITRHLVLLMGGTISLNTTVGQGTVVTVTLPLAEAPQIETGHVATQAVNLERLAGLRVLVADDNRTNRRILESLLTNMNMLVTLAEDGQQAFERFEPGAFDLLLLDISMPGLDGVGALKKIRGLEAVHDAPPVPALAVTANAMQHQIDEYLASGFAGHVAKPFRKADLLDTIATIHLTNA